MTQSTNDGTRLARRSFILLGIMYIIFAVSTLIPSLAIVSLFTMPLKMVLVGPIAFHSTSVAISYALLLTGLVLLVIGYLLRKRNIIGVYLGWLFILVGVVTISSSTFLVLVYLIYVNYRAHKTLRSEYNSV